MPSPALCRLPPRNLVRLAGTAPPALSLLPTQTRGACNRVPHAVPVGEGLGEESVKDADKTVGRHLRTELSESCLLALTVTLWLDRI